MQTVLYFPLKMTATAYMNLCCKYDCKTKIHSKKMFKGPYLNNLTSSGQPLFSFPSKSSFWNKQPVLTILYSLIPQLINFQHTAICFYPHCLPESTLPKVTNSLLWVRNGLTEEYR